MPGGQKRSRTHTLFCRQDTAASLSLFHNRFTGFIICFTRHAARRITRPHALTDHARKAHVRLDIKNGARKGSLMPMIDRSLIHQARKCITGANVHDVETWILCYELSKPRSVEREHYKTILKEFVTTERVRTIRQEGGRMPS